MGHDTMTTGEVEQLKLKTNQSTGRNRCLDGRAMSITAHVLDTSTAVCQGFHHSPSVFFWHLDKESFKRLLNAAIFTLFGNNHRAGNEHLVTFAAHGFNKHCDLHRSPGSDFKNS